VRDGRAAAGLAASRPHLWRNHDRTAPAAPPVLLLALLALAGCGKVQEAASEKAAEKMIEATIKDGSNAKVDIHDGGVKVQGTDEKGQSFNMEMGSASISEKDLGIPFYPGATGAQPEQPLRQRRPRDAAGGAEQPR
jgi:hypothetical protein